MNMIENKKQPDEEAIREILEAVLAVPPASQQAALAYLQGIAAGYQAAHTTAAAS